MSNSDQIESVSLNIVDINDEKPESVIAKLCSGDDELGLVALRYSYKQYWLEGSPAVTLIAMYWLGRYFEQGQIHFSVADTTLCALDDKLVLPAAGQSGLTAWSKLNGVPVFSTDQPIPLVPIDVPKPWGREVWYTGIEERGTAGAGTPEHHIPLPYVLSALPEVLCGNKHEQLVLLKILDPLPTQIYGDLYFELHQEKREVYVVTHVDADAWPSGEGQMRFGFSQLKRQEYASDDKFRQAFLAAVKNYEEVRRSIDSQLDDLREAQGVGLTTPVSAAQTAAWLETIPPELKELEQQNRFEMEAFTESIAMSLGDVVKVPCFTPHSLQHGVRTVEFQTPVYERMILSFAQKVLTQEHWDTEAALSVTHLEVPAQSEHQKVSESSTMLVERIVDFDDFEVFRVKLKPNTSELISAPGFIEGGRRYSLLMAIDHGLVISTLKLQAEQAVMLPESAGEIKITNNSPDLATFLLAYPK